MGGLKSDHSYSGYSANHSNCEHFCEICNTEFEDAEGLNEHTARVHGTHRSRPLERLDPLLREILENKKAIIHRRHERGAIQNSYNVPLPDPTGSLTYTDLENQLEQIFESEENAFKINFGFVLKDVNGSLRYYYPQNNNMLLDIPVTISNRADVEKLKKKINSLDIIQSIFQQR